MRRDPRLVAVPVVLLLGAITWVASATAPTPPHSVAALSSVIAVRDADLVCPQAGGTPTGGAARIAYADGTQPGSASGTSGVGASTLTAAPLGGSPSAVPISPGHAWVVDGPATQGPVQIAVSGPLTAGLTALQFTRTAVGVAPELAATPCETPTTDAWFAGFSSVAGAHADLLLSNEDAVAATVDVTVWGGENGAPGAKRGIRVDPQMQVDVPLDQIEPGLSVAAAHVVATSGRVVPALRYDAENGSIPIGVDWVPRTDPPALKQTVPGLLSGAGSRRLVVADPGDVDATFSLTVVTADGSFEPTDFASLTVQAGGIQNVTLDPVLQEEAAAVIVSSTQPVVAGGVSTLPPDATGASDFGFTAAVPALSGRTVVAGGEVKVSPEGAVGNAALAGRVVSSAARHTQVVLSAPGDDASVTLTILPSVAGSSPVQSPVVIAGGTTVVIDIGSVAPDPAPAVAITPDGGGPVFAAWSLSETSDTTADLTELVLRTPVRSLLSPPVRFDPAVGVR
jgi:hypothetical protein